MHAGDGAAAAAGAGLLGAAAAALGGALPEGGPLDGGPPPLPGFARPKEEMAHPRLLPMPDVQPCPPAADTHPPPPRACHCDGRPCMPTRVPNVAPTSARSSAIKVVLQVWVEAKQECPRCVLQTRMHPGA